ncbi:hypothetical protein SAMN04488028_102247 [Reichenbachiella agariperforans]|uniref:STAS/SEC14 domain-containing protein n=1 Tax=Reichenbachiella agariperforans TaxID=156994 RepID=A0A1M6NG89_REIAG|nr:hypothetical protein [Reichenbachiella agariperforans]SHJ94730.1 hypothetical protein SAMN04488028_102247 [Reichenbachiella agariperforans]
MNSFYEKEGFVTANIDLSDKSMYIKWAKLSNDSVIEECCLAQIEQVKNGVIRMYLDVSDAVGVPKQERQKWFETVLFPAFSEHGLKVAVTILPASAITKLASKKWVETSSPFSFDMFEAKDLASAKELAKGY